MGTAVAPGRVATDADARGAHDELRGGGCSLDGMLHCATLVAYMPITTGIAPATSTAATSLGLLTSDTWYRSAVTPALTNSSPLLRMATRGRCATETSASPAAAHPNVYARVSDARRTEAPNRRSDPHRFGGCTCPPAVPRGSRRISPPSGRSVGVSGAASANGAYPSIAELSTPRRPVLAHSDYAGRRRVSPASQESTLTNFVA